MAPQKHPTSCSTPHISPHPSPRPPDIDSYMKKKRLEWKRKKKDAIEKTRSEILARRLKLKTLEKERRERLCVISDRFGDHEKLETVRRPRWDSNTSFPASNNPHGPWSNLSELQMEIDFPLPKPVDEEESPALFVDSDVESKHTFKSNSLKVSNSLPLNSGICVERINSFSQVHSGNRYTWSSDQGETETSLPSSGGTKSRRKQRILKSMMNDAGKRKGRQVSRNSLKVDKKKSIPLSNYLRSQEGKSVSDKCRHTSLGSTNQHNKICSPNKRKMMTFSSADHNVNACEKRHKMPVTRQTHSREIHIQDVSLQQGFLTTCSDQNDANVKTELDHAQYITYHLEKLPYKYQTEVLNERKRLALLKLLARQLANRINEAQTCISSSAHSSTVEEHAFLLRYNLAKFQKRLHSIEKALELDNVQSTNEKTSGYIVLPCKYQRSYRDSSSATTQQIGFQGHTCMEMKNVLTEQISSSDVRLNTVTSHEDKKRDAMPDNKNCKPGEGLQTWDHQLLAKELEKLDAEIRETKTRMANKLVSVSPTVDQEQAASVTSNLEDDNHILHQMTVTIDVGTRSQNVVLFCNEKHANFTNHLPPASEIIESNVRDDVNRKQNDSTKDCGESVKIENIEDKDSNANRSFILKYEENEVSLEKKLRNSMDCTAELRSKEGKDRNEASITTFACNIDGCLADSVDISCPHNRTTNKEVPDNASLYVEPEMDNSVSTNDKPKGTLTMEIVSQRKIGKDAISESITDSIMQELFDDELSEVLLHYQPICFPKIRPISPLAISSTSNLANCDVAISSTYNHANCDVTISSTCNPANCEEQYGSRFAGVVQYNMMNCKTDIHERSRDIHDESFEAISERLVDKIVKKLYEENGVCSSSLLDTYASCKTMWTVVAEHMSAECGEIEGVHYEKLLLDLICECLDNCYSRIYIPSYFLFLRECPDGAQLRQILIAKMNEQTIAICEGGFSLDHMVVRDADKEYWRTHYSEMMEMVGDVSEQVLQDMIEEAIAELGGSPPQGGASPTVTASNGERQLVQSVD